MIRSLFRQCLLSTVLVVGLASCSSPLDVDAPRNIIPLTPAVLVTPSSVVADLSSTSGTFALTGTPTIRLDTTVTPAIVWMDLTMETRPHADATPSLLSFRLKVDSLTADGYETRLSGEPNRHMSMNIRRQNGMILTNVDASSNDEASIIVAEQPRAANGKRRIVVIFSISVNRLSVVPDVDAEYAGGRLVIEI